MFFDTHTAAEAASITAAIGAGLVAVWKIIKGVYKMARRVEDIAEFTVTEKHAREQLDKALRRHIDREDKRDEHRDIQLQKMEDNLDEIMREVRPNGGSSLKDLVQQTNTRVAVLEEWKRTHI